MRISFLSAADGTPLTKTFTQDEQGKITKTSYPKTYEFTSFSTEVSTIEEFYDRILTHAKFGHCLLKGTLHRDLTGEHRRDSTKTEDATQWLLLDLDGVQGFDTPADFIRLALSPEFHDVSYIYQASASEGLEKRSGLNCHLFFILEEPISAPLLKLYLENINYDNPVLSEQLQLAAGGASFRYPLDITTCQNDKLIYISPPTFEGGLVDPLGDNRLQLISGSRNTVELVTPRLNIEIIRSKKHDLIYALRAKSGLPKKTISYKCDNGIAYIANPDQATITGIRDARGFTYLNLDGGDSWSYYYPTDNPVFLRTFKDPDAVWLLKDINPEYAKTAEANKPKPKITGLERIPLVFRDVATDTYYNGFYFPDTKTHELYPAKRTSLKDFMINAGQQPPKVIPDWTIKFDPTCLDAINFDNKTVNTFVPTPYLSRSTPGGGKNSWTLIERILRHALGGDEKTYHKFLNWLAYVFQTREKAQTAWVISGTEGTGKGLIIEHILTPLFGEKYCIMRNLDTIEDSFNKWMEECVILNFNEARISDSGSISKVVNKLRAMITDKSLSVRGMRTDWRSTDNFINLIVTSNYNDAIVVTESDRRWHIAPRQEEKIVISRDEVLNGIPLELDAFANFLHDYPVDIADVTKVDLTDAKHAMILATLSSHDQFFNAFKQGDLNYFAEHLSTKQSSSEPLIYPEFHRIVVNWLTDAEANRKTLIRIEDIRVVYGYLQASKQTKPNQFKRMLAHQDIYLESMYTDSGELVSATHIQWRASAQLIKAWVPKEKQIQAK